MLKSCFRKVCVDFVPLNILPAFVYYCEKVAFWGRQMAWIKMLQESDGETADVVIMSDIWEGNAITRSIPFYFFTRLGKLFRDIIRLLLIKGGWTADRRRRDRGDLFIQGDQAGRQQDTDWYSKEKRMDEDTPVRKPEIWGKLGRLLCWRQGEYWFTGLIRLYMRN